MSEEAMDPVCLYIYLHTSGLSSVRVRLPAAALPPRLKPPLVSESLFLQLLVEDAGRVFSQRVSRRGGQILPYAPPLYVLQYQLHWAWRATSDNP